ncbi:hypothetical protein D3C78_1547370 [compost metagenome]
MLGIGVVDLDVHAGSEHCAVLGELGESRSIEVVVSAGHEGSAAGSRGDDHVGGARMVQHQQRTRPSLLRLARDGAGSHVGSVAVHRPRHVRGLEVASVVVDVHR